MVLAYLKLLGPSWATMSKFFLKDKSETAILCPFAVEILGNSKAPILTVAGHSLEARLQTEAGDWAQLHVSTQAESQRNGQHSSENKQKHQPLWGTESMGGAGLETLCSAFRNKTISTLLHILNKITCHS